MSRDYHEDLCQRIKAHCQQRQWYGPDMGFYFDSWHDPNPERHDFQTGFIPPATEEQIRLAEEKLGFSYPPLLRIIYITLAIDGFGPAYGLASIEENSSLGFFEQRAHRVELEQLEMRQYPRTQDYYALDNIWPSNMLYLCHWGCAYFSYMHTTTGRYII